MNLKRCMGASLAFVMAACSGGSSDDDPFIVLVPRWINQQRRVTVENLRAVRFANPAQGIVVGDATSIYRTDDGGQTWYQLEHSPFSRGGDVLALDILGLEMHAVGRDENSLGRFWFTDDAVNWRTADQPGSGAPFSSVDLVNPGGGAANISLYLRTDGQIVRQQAGALDTKNVPNLSTNKATSIDAQFSGTTAVVGTNGYFAVSLDFGHSWHDFSAAPAVANPSGTTADLFCVQVVDWTQNDFFACGANGTIVTTKQDAAPDPHPDLETVTAGDAATETLRAIHFPLDLQHGWAVGDDGRIVKIDGTYDAMTLTWSFTRTNQTSGTTADLHGIHMVDADVGYAVGDGGLVLKTTDGGATWQSPLAAGVGRTQTMNAVSFASDAARGLAVGDASTTPDATLLRTSDAGATWTLSNTGVPSQDLIGVAVPRTGSGSVAYALGASGLYRNLDAFGAGAWAAVGNVPAGTWRAILAPAGDGTLVLAGDAGRVAVTVTGTASPPTWLESTLAGTPDLACLNAVVDTRSLTQIAVFAGGAGGHLWRTELDGAWTQASFTAALTADLLSLGGAAFPLIFAGGDDGSIHRLTEVTLTPLLYSPEAIAKPAGSGDPISVAFPTASLGWWLASNGIWTTENANGTPVVWTKSPVHLTLALPPASPPLLAKTTTSLSGLWMHPGGLNGYAVGAGGTILRTLTGGKE